MKKVHPSVLIGPRAGQRRSWVRLIAVVAALWVVAWAVPAAVEGTGRVTGVTDPAATGATGQPAPTGSAGGTGASSDQLALTTPDNEWQSLPKLNPIFSRIGFSVFGLALTIGTFGSAAFLLGVWLGFIAPDARDKILRFLRTAPAPVPERLIDGGIERPLTARERELAALTAEDDTRPHWGLIALFVLSGGLVAAVFQWAQLDQLAPIQALVLGATWPSVVSRMMAGGEVPPTLPPPGGLDPLRGGPTNPRPDPINGLTGGTQPPALVGTQGPGTALAASPSPTPPAPGPGPLTEPSPDEVFKP